MTQLPVDKKTQKAAAQYCRERNILIPTFGQMRDPTSVPSAIRDELSGIGLWDVHPRNLFRVTWKNEPVPSGGGFGSVNYVELPSSLTGTPARIMALVGKWFPTGAHKVGATFGCLVPELVSGRFDPLTQKAAWPSTGNFCRGGAYVAALLGCQSIAILPEGMSRERFEWLRNIAGEVIATPGSESNVKEIFDKCAELAVERDDVVIFNQFAELGNRLWHYEVTGPAMQEVAAAAAKEGAAVAGVVLSSGSGGTLGAADYLKDHLPGVRLAVAEALQCPTLLENGFGAHRIEGIGDKHIPWIHNVRNTDMVIAVDDNTVVRLLRLFNHPDGREYLIRHGAPAETVNRLDLLGISSIGNLLAAIKFARYYELTEHDVVFTVFTDSMELYGSRLDELESEGAYGTESAARDFEALQSLASDNLLELTHTERRRIHNLKYYTWIEQQGKALEELNRQWHEWREYWNVSGEAENIDARINEFNRMAGWEI